MRLKPIDDLDDLLALAVADPARALAFVELRLHRAALVMSTQPADLPGAGFSLWPAYAGEWWDDGFEGSKLSDADVVRRIEQWGDEVPRPEPGEVDEADRTLALLQGIEPRAWRVVISRAWQEHRGRRSWRSIGRRVGVSHTMAARLHSDAVRHALGRLLSRPQKSLNNSPPSRFTRPPNFTRVAA